VMVVVVGLVLVVDWAVGTARGSVMLRRSYWALIGLTIPVVASAFVRLIVYIDAFGLTQLRALTTVGVVWMAGVLVWAGRTVVRGQRERFIEPAIAALLAVLVLINVANFDARIAQVNLAALGDQPLDQGYLSEGLSPDAIPTVADFIATSSDPCLHVDLAGRLWARERGDVRSWNLGASRAHAHIDRALAAVADCPPR